MFPTLLESSRKTDTQSALRVGSVSLALHASVIVAAAYGTLHRGPVEVAARRDTMVVLLAPSRHTQPPAQSPAPLLQVPKGFQTIVAPPAVPANLPRLDLQERFDPKDFSGSGVEGGRADGSAADDNQVYLETVVEQRPQLLSGPPPYPDLLREAGIQGRVVLLVVIDTSGRVEPASIKILEAPTAAFERPTRQWARTALFRPARLRGRAVRALVRLPLDYSVTRD